jgi:D-alanine-D-alanine ligase-like ATP-grasp enzyme
MPSSFDPEPLVLPSGGRIGVLSGGRSRERARSLVSGQTACASLQRQGYTARLIDTADPGFLTQLGHVDVAFLAIAGQHAEDGKLQSLLEPRAIPYTGSGVLETGGELRALPVLETRPKGDFYDHQTKNNPHLYSYRCPADLPEALAAAIAEQATAAHRALGCSGYSRSDFVVTDAGQVVWLEVNTLPGLSATGNLATMAQADGLGYDGLIRHILSTALAEYGYRP